MLKWIAGGLLTAAAIPANGATVVVQANANSIAGGTGALFGPVVNGQSLVVASSTDDLWSAGALPRYSDANGLVFRLATATDDSGQPVGTQIGADFGTTTQDGFNTRFGTLVGRIGTTYQVLGANYNGTAWGTGNLELFYWDSNLADNFGEITFDIRAGGGAVPEPSAWLMAIVGFGVAGGAMRRARQRRVELTYA